MIGSERRWCAQPLTGETMVTAVLGGSVELPSRHVFSGSPLFSPIFSSCLPHVKCPLKRLPSLKHLAAFNIASKAADFKLNCTSCSAVTKQTWSALRSLFLGCSGVAVAFIFEARLPSVRPGGAAGVPGLTKQVGGLFMCE